MMANTHELRDGRASPEEQFHIFTAENLNELSERYGSVEAAGERYRWLRECGQIWKGHSQRSEAWWAGPNRAVPRTSFRRSSPAGRRDSRECSRRRSWSVVGSGFGQPVTRPRRRAACTSETVTSSVKVSCGACPLTDPTMTGPGHGRTGCHRTKCFVSLPCGAFADVCAGIGSGYAHDLRGAWSIAAVATGMPIAPLMSSDNPRTATMIEDHDLRRLAHLLPSLPSVVVVQGTERGRTERRVPPETSVKKSGLRSSGCGCSGRSGTSALSDPPASRGSRVVVRRPRHGSTRHLP